MEGESKECNEVLPPLLHYDMVIESLIIALFCLWEWDQTFEKLWLTRLSTQRWISSLHILCFWTKSILFFEGAILINF